MNLLDYYWLAEQRSIQFVCNLLTLSVSSDLKIGNDGSTMIDCTTLFAQLFVLVCTPTQKTTLVIHFYIILFTNIDIKMSVLVCQTEIVLTNFIITCVTSICFMVTNVVDFNEFNIYRHFLKIFT